jgi:hypothetical protein
MWNRTNRGPHRRHNVRASSLFPPAPPSPLWPFVAWRPPFRPSLRPERSRQQAKACEGKIAEQLGKILVFSEPGERWRTQIKALSEDRGSSIHVPPEWSWARTELWRSGDTSSVQAGRRGRGAPIRPGGAAARSGRSASERGAARQGVEQVACRFSAPGDGRPHDRSTIGVEAGINQLRSCKPVGFWPMDPITQSRAVQTEMRGGARHASQSNALRLPSRPAAMVSGSSANEYSPTVSDPGRA